VIPAARLTDPVSHDARAQRRRLLDAGVQLEGRVVGRRTARRLRRSRPEDEQVGPAGREPRVETASRRGCACGRLLHETVLTLLRVERIGVTRAVVDGDAAERERRATIVLDVDAQQAPCRRGGSEDTRVRVSVRRSFVGARTGPLEVVGRAMQTGHRSERDAAGQEVGGIGGSERTTGRGERVHRRSDQDETGDHPRNDAFQASLSAHRSPSASHVTSEAKRESPKGPESKREIAVDFFFTASVERGPELLPERLRPPGRRLGTPW
jgi:hypothetical protein